MLSPSLNIPTYTVPYRRWLLSPSFFYQAWDWHYQSANSGEVPPYTGCRSRLYIQ